MVALPESARAVLDSGALAHLVTLESDGRPQVSIVWVGLDGDEIVSAHLPEHRKVRKSAGTLGSPYPWKPARETPWGSTST